MWVCKIVFFPDETAIFSPLTKKYNLILLGYPLSYFYKNKKYYYVGAGILIGDEKNKNKVTNILKKDKRVKNMERKGDYFIGIFEQQQRLKELYNPELIRVNPVIIDDKGNEIWEMGSLNRKVLMNFAKNAREKYGNCKLVKFKRETAVNLSVLNIIPELTSKQKQAMELAIKNGYYEYPREIELEKLAKMMKISYSTYQAHIRKAEHRLLPFLFEKAR